MNMSSFTICVRAVWWISVLWLSLALAVMVYLFVQLHDYLQAKYR